MVISTESPFSQSIRFIEFLGFVCLSLPEEDEGTETFLLFGGA